MQETSAGGSKLVVFVPFFEWVSPEVQHSSIFTVGGLLEIGRYHMTMHCHSPVEKF